MKVLLDAGPALNFLAVGQENALVRLADSRGLSLAVPETVDREVLGLCRGPRFGPTSAPRTWGQLKAAGRVGLLPDDLAERDFSAAVARASGMPATERVRDRRSLGELMVVAHASLLAQQGHQAYVLMDDGDGRRRVRREITWLTATGAAGSVMLWSTGQVLHHAGSHGWILRGLTWQQVYRQMRPFDDGLPPLP